MPLCDGQHYAAVVICDAGTSGAYLLSMDSGERFGIEFEWVRKKVAQLLFVSTPDTKRRTLSLQKLSIPQQDDERNDCGPYMLCAIECFAKFGLNSDCSRWFSKYAAKKCREKLQTFAIKRYLQQYS